jgi:hypothetical protein
MKLFQSILKIKISDTAIPLYKANEIVSLSTAKEKPIQIRHKV